MSEQQRKTMRLDTKVAKQLEQVAIAENKPENMLVNEALKYYFDYCYMQNHATIINREILKLNEAQLEFLENKINHKTNQLLSSLAIQVSILMQIVAENLEVNPMTVDSYRKVGADFLKTNNRVFQLKELI